MNNYFRDSSTKERFRNTALGKAARIWSYISIPPYFFVAEYLIKHKDHFILAFYLNNLRRQRNL